MRKIVITGGRGQLGMELMDLLRNEYHIFAPTRYELDITKKQQVEQYLDDVRPYAIIHAAAYTQVDAAEIDPSLPILVNAVGTRFLAAAAERIGARMIYISTDYVFDGKRQTPYSELDIPSPLNVYGLSKLAGEKFVASLCSRYCIVRTSWLYGRYKENFVTKVIELAKQRKKMKMITDQFGSPTNAADLAKFTRQLLLIDAHGIYHASNAGHCSRYEFSNTIVKLLGMKGTIIPCRYVDFPVLARRPKNSQLISHRGGPQMRHWEAALAEYIREGASVDWNDALFYRSSTH